MSLVIGGAPFRWGSALLAEINFLAAKVHRFRADKDTPVFVQYLIGEQSQEIVFTYLTVPRAGADVFPVRQLCCRFNSEKGYPHAMVLQS
jgi:hypothetical protein